MSEFLLIVENITKRYGDKTILDNISFSVEKGTVYGLLGPNGAGKTTLLSIIAGVLEPTSGKVRINGYDPRDLVARKKIGYCPQDPAVYEELTGFENMMFYARLYGLNEHEAKNKIKKLLETMGLSEHANKLVSKYSGGMKKRLSLAITLLPEPELLILDEPTTGMDPSVKREIWDIILDLKKQGKTILLATHNMEEADLLSDKVAIINEGKIIVEGTPEELKSKYGPKSVVLLELSKPQSDKVVELLRNNVEVVQKIDESNIKIFTSNPDEIVPKIVTLLYENNITINSLRVTKPTLEDVFIKLTGRRLV